MCARDWPIPRSHTTPFSAIFDWKTKKLSDHCVDTNWKENIFGKIKGKSRKWETIFFLLYFQFSRVGWFFIFIPNGFDSHHKRNVLCPPPAAPSTFTPSRNLFLLLYHFPEDIYEFSSSIFYYLLMERKWEKGCENFRVSVGLGFEGIVYFISKL